MTSKTLENTPPLTRYTRFVRSAKMGLGGVALVLIGLMLFYPLFRQQEAGVRISFNATSKKEAEPAAMKSPRFHGLDKDNQPYVMTADSATEQVDKQVTFEKPAGEILLKSNQRLSVSANAGRFDKESHHLWLNGNVVMSNDQGYVMTTDALTVDIAHKNAVTSSAVHGQGPLGTLKAYSGAMADGNNQQIIFEGPVFVTLNMSNTSKTSGENSHEKQ